MNTTYRNLPATYVFSTQSGEERWRSAVTWHCSKNTEKISVDAGSFTPGVYRVNPYDVWSEELEVEYVANYRFTWFHLVPLVFEHQGYTAAAVLNGSISEGLPPVSADLMQQALQKAHAKILQSDLSLGEDLGELRQTLQMLKDPFKSLLEFLHRDNMRNLKRIKDLLEFLKTGAFGGKSGKGAARAAADTWLELRYGFRPLVMLVGDLVEQASKQANSLFDPNKIRSVRSKIEMEPFIEAKGTGMPVYISGGSSTTDFPGWYSHKTTVTLVGYAQVQYRQENEMSVLQELGLTPSFWPEIAWELTSLSFVWDWFISVGPWLGSLRVKPGITILGNTTAVKMVRRSRVDLERFQVDPGTYSPWFGSGTRTLRRYKRVVGTELPLTPKLRLNAALDVNKLIDSLSLIFQRIFR